MKGEYQLLTTDDDDDEQEQLIDMGVPVPTYITLNPTCVILIPPGLTTFKGT